MDILIDNIFKDLKEQIYYTIMGVSIDNFKSMTLSSKEVEGYILCEDKIKNISLVLVKVHNKFWKTIWLSNKEYQYKMPAQALSTIFTS